jgi:hypothetical protein
MGKRTINFDENDVVGYDGNGDGYGYGNGGDG